MARAALQRAKKRDDEEADDLPEPEPEDEEPAAAPPAEEVAASAEPRSGPEEPALEAGTSPASVQITQQPPELLTKDEGAPVLLRVRAKGGSRGEPLCYQWHKDLAQLEGETRSTLRLSAATAEHAGAYSVRIWCESQPEKVESRSTQLVIVAGDLANKVRAIIEQKGEQLTDDAPTLVVCDFAGQRMYYVLHQIMLTEALTIYVVVVTLEYPLEHELGLSTDDELPYPMTCAQNLDFWLRSIHARAPRAKIQIVCTKLDLVSEAVRDERVQAIEELCEGQLTRPGPADPVREQQNWRGHRSRPRADPEAQPYDEAEGWVCAGTAKKCRWDGSSSIPSRRSCSSEATSASA